MTKNLFSFVVDHLIFILFTKNLLTCHLFSPFIEAFLWNNTHIGIFTQRSIQYGFTCPNHVLFMVLAVLDAKVMIESEANIIPFR